MEPMTRQQRYYSENREKCAAASRHWKAEGKPQLVAKRNAELSWSARRVRILLLVDPRTHAYTNAPAEERL